MPRGRLGAAAAALALCAGAATGCATYTDNLLQASQAASGGNYAAAVESLNDMLGVDDATQAPRKSGADVALATLERGTLLQSLGRFDDSARDLSYAESEIELIDLSTDPVGTLGSYIYSDSAKPYAALPSERLTLNAINLLNYLAVGDLEGAAVEARRFQVTREYLESEGIGESGIAPFGAYLAGFVFEHKGEGDRALRYYDDALAGGPLRSLAAPVARLAAVHPYRGDHIEDLAVAPPATAKRAEGAELLFVFNLGRVPHKEPKRVPVGLAIGLIGADVTDDIRFLSRSAGKVVVYPELVETPSSTGTPAVRVDGVDVPADALVDLAAVVRREYDQIKPKILLAALTRLASRAAMAEGVRKAGGQGEQWVGDVLSILFEAGMAALDRPDTRSWTMMPARVHVARAWVPAGVHRIDIGYDGFAGGARTIDVDVPAGGFQAIVVTEPR